MGTIPLVEDWALDAECSEPLSMLLPIELPYVVDLLELLFGYFMTEPGVALLHVVNLAQQFQQQ